MGNEIRSVAVPKEIAPETRVALVPTALARLREAGLEVLVESGAGLAAGFTDEEYREHGATLGTSEVVAAADAVVRVQLPRFPPDEFERAPAGQALIALTDVMTRPDLARRAARSSISLFALDLMPRISRAQSMDVLSSQATISGYKAVIIAAERLPKVFPMMTTAAGTLPPAQVLVVGAGVAGLTAIATARRLGAVVQAYDVRPAAQEEIQSVGARAVLLPLQPGDAEDPSGYAKELGVAFYARQQQLLAEVVAGVDVVVTTATIPGAAAPLLITRGAVDGMKRGAVIVDCAAEHGGNCELTRADETYVTTNGVAILGPTNLPATVPHEASAMFARNVTEFILHLVAQPMDGDLEDEIVRGTMVTRTGDIVHPKIVSRLEEERDERPA